MKRELQQAARDAIAGKGQGMAHNLFKFICHSLVFTKDKGV